MNPFDAPVNPLDFHTLDQKSWSFQDIIGQQQGRFPGALRDFISVKDPQFGAKGDGVTDDTAAISAAITSGLLTHSAVYMPAGTYLVTSQLTVIPGQFKLYGDGKQSTTLLFRPSADNVACLKLSNGASQALNITLRDFGISSDDSTHIKIAIDLYDIGECDISNIYIHGTVNASPGGSVYFSGGTGGSFGIRTHGRDSCHVYDLEIAADNPVYIAANPNSSADNCEDMDHWTWDGYMYLLPVSHYAITVADGLGIQNTKFEGSQAWVGGKGGFFMNDTRAAPTVASHDIVFRNVRGEQGTDATGYWFDMSFAFQITGLNFENILGASGTQGFNLTKVFRASFKHVTMATSNGKNAIVATPSAIDSVMTWEDCYWQPNSVVTLTDWLVSSLSSWDSTLSQAPANVVWTYKTAAYRNYWSAAPNTQTGATYTVLPVDTSIIANRAGTVTLTLEAATGVPGKSLYVRTIQAQTVVSASSDVVPLAGGAAGTAILAATAGKWALLQSDGTNWQITASN